MLCGGLSHLIRTAWEVQVEAGWPPELAYFDCFWIFAMLTFVLVFVPLFMKRSAAQKWAHIASE